MYNGVVASISPNFLARQLLPEDLKRLVPFRVPAATLDDEITLTCPRAWRRRLEDKAAALNQFCAKKGIELYAPITVDDVLRSLLHWYLETNGWPHVIGEPTEGGEG